MTAKMDMRLVPDMKAVDTYAKVRAHLDRRGFQDIAVVQNGGVNEVSETPPDSVIVKAQQRVYAEYGIDAMLLPRMGGSWPGSVFTAAPLRLPAGHFGLGYGERAHAPDEFCVIDSTNPRIHGLDDLVRSYVDILYALG